MNSIPGLLSIGLLALSATSVAQTSIGLEPRPQRLPDLSRSLETLLLAVDVGHDVLTLDLERSSVLGDGIRYDSELPSVTYRGSLLEEPASRAYASVRDGVLRALVWRVGEPEPWWILPADEYSSALAPGEHVAVRTSEVETIAGSLPCGTRLGEGGLPHSGGSMAASSGTRLVEVIIEADHEYYLMAGSVQAAQDLIEETILFSSAIYEYTFGIRFEVVDWTIWQDSNDPYTATTGTQLLSQFNTRMWNTWPDAEVDIAQLFTDRFPNGGTAVNGQAYVDEFCVPHAFKRPVSWVRHLASPTQRAILTTHEFGHTFGAQHCDGDPDCGFMYPYMSGSIGQPFGSQSIASIGGNPGLVNCTDPTTPSGVLPTLSAVTPQDVEALGFGSYVSPTTTLTGTALGFTHQVQLDGEVIGLLDFEPLDDQTIVVNLPTPSARGSVDVHVVNAIGASNVLSLDYVATSPPRWNVQNNEYPLGLFLDHGGTPGVAYQVLVSTSSTTYPLGGVQVLEYPASVVETGVLDAVGLGHSELFPAQGTYWIQLLTRDNGALFATTPMQVSY